MTKIDESEFERVVSATKARPASWRAGPVRHPRVLKNQRAAGKMFDSTFTKAGLDVGKLNKMLAQDQRELRGLFQKQGAEAAKHFSAAEAAYRQGVAARTKALGMLTKPFTSTFITLGKPFLIWQLPNPQLNIFIDSHVEAMNSSVKILINTNAGSDNTQFVFYFLWENESDFFSVINASSSLVFNGSCEVDAAAGIFSGDSSYLNMDAALSTMRWSGWGADPMSGQSNDQTPYPDYQQSQFQTVAALHTQGGHIFGDQGVDPQGFLVPTFRSQREFYTCSRKSGRRIRSDAATFVWVR